jgi:hypothetical protein
MKQEGCRKETGGKPGRWLVRRQCKISPTNIVKNQENVKTKYKINSAIYGERM